MSHCPRIDSRPCWRRRACSHPWQMNDLLSARMAAQHGAVASAEAYSCGYTKLSLGRVVSSGELIRVRTGAFVDARMHGDATPEGRHALAALAIARSFDLRHSVSHYSAVAVLGLPLLAGDLDVTHLSRRSLGDQRRGQGLQIHRPLGKGAVRTVAGWPSCIRRSQWFRLRPWPG